MKRCTKTEYLDKEKIREIYASIRKVEDTNTGLALIDIFNALIRQTIEVRPPKRKGKI